MEKKAFYDYKLEIISIRRLSFNKMFCESGEDLPRTRTLFLKICAICYSIAFLSLYPQISGLYGPNGLLPVHSLLDSSSALNKNNEYKPDVFVKLIKDRPTLLWFVPYIAQDMLAQISRYDT